jgi:hypothetical protein
VPFENQLDLAFKADAICRIRECEDFPGPRDVGRGQIRIFGEPGNPLVAHGKPIEALQEKAMPGGAWQWFHFHHKIEAAQKGRVNLLDSVGHPEGGSGILFEDPGMSTALRPVGLLGVLSSTPAGPSVARLVSMPVCAASLRNLVRKAG